MDSIRVLADETDGRAIVNRNDLAAGMRQIIRDSSAYYLVGYNSKKAPSDGKFHEIKVRVKRSGVEVRHRKGYWALTPDETARAVAPPKPIVPKDVDTALGALQTAPRGPVHQQLGRPVARSERQDEGDLRLGAGDQRAGQRRAAGAGAADRRRRRRRAVLPRGRRPTRPAPTRPPAAHSA